MKTGWKGWTIYRWLKSWNERDYFRKVGETEVKIEMKEREKEVRKGWKNRRKWTKIRKEKRWIGCKTPKYLKKGTML